MDQTERTTFLTQGGLNILEDHEQPVSQWICKFFASLTTPANKDFDCVVMEKA